MKKLILSLIILTGISLVSCSTVEQSTKSSVPYLANHSKETKIGNINQDEDPFALHRVKLLDGRWYVTKRVGSEQYITPLSETENFLTSSGRDSLVWREVYVNRPFYIGGLKVKSVLITNQELDVDFLNSMNKENLTNKDYKYNVSEICWEKGDDTLYYCQLDREIPNSLHFAFMQKEKTTIGLHNGTGKIKLYCDEIMIPVKATGKEKGRILSSFGKPIVEKANSNKEEVSQSEENPSEGTFSPQSKSPSISRSQTVFDEDFILHIVGEGETIFDIATYYRNLYPWAKVSRIIEIMRALNPKIDLDSLYLGLKIRVYKIPQGS